MYDLNINSQVLCWYFMENDYYVDNDKIQNIIIKSLIKGAIDFFSNKGKRGIKKELPLVIWLTKYSEEKYVNNNLPYISKAWAVLVSNFVDGDEQIIFDDLLNKFSLEMYKTFHCYDIYDLMNFEPELMCIIYDEIVIVPNELLARYNISKYHYNFMRYGKININLPKKSEALIPEADESINDIFVHNLVFDIYYTFTIYDNLIDSFIKGINKLKGSPSLKQLINVLSKIGVNVRKDDIKQLGITKINIYDRLVIPEITIQKSLNDNLAKVVLEHEIGHLIMHLPILIASSLEYTFTSLASYKIPVNDLIKRNTKLLEKEADWVASLLFIPPITHHYIKTMGTNDENITVISYNKGDKFVEETEEFRIWRFIRRSIYGQGELSWDEYLDDKNEYEKLEHDNDYLYSDSMDLNSIDELVIRYTNMVVHRNDIKPFYYERDELIQNIFYSSSNTIVEYCGRYESE